MQRNHCDLGEVHFMRVTKSRSPSGNQEREWRTEREEVVKIVRRENKAEGGG